MVLKALQLLSCLPDSPREFLDRTAAIISARWETAFGGRPEYRTIGVEEGFVRLGEALGPVTAEGLGDATLAQIEARVRERLAVLPVDAPFTRFHNGDTLLGRLCYTVARSLRPGAVVETGVCYGVTSAHLLAALEANGEGHLHSIDLPPLGKNGDDFVGWLVPSDLRQRWTLRRGASGSLLGPLVAELGSVDLFIHDSLHTYKNMKMEFEAVWPTLRAGGVLISDDVEGNGAFLELAERADVSVWVVIQEKDKNALLGVAVKRK